MGRKRKRTNCKNIERKRKEKILEKNNKSDEEYHSQLEYSDDSYVEDDKVSFGIGKNLRYLEK